MSARRVVRPRAELRAAAPALVGSVVRVHVNLTHGDVTISHDGRVCAAADHVTLTDVRFIVRESTRRQCVERGERQVHAWAEGTLRAVGTPAPAGAAAITYNPHRGPDFIAHGEPITSAARVTFGDRRGWLHA